MPLFEYKCKKCDHTFERIVNHHKKKVKCPICGSQTKKQQPVPGNPVIR